MREEVLARRKLWHRPWHGPPHFSGQQTDQYLITVTCYEHAPILGSSDERMDDFVLLVHQAFEDAEATIHAWVLLPNHYHVLATVADLTLLLGRLGRLHGRTSFTWNKEEGMRGRKCWHRVSDRAMRSEAHFWATMNYVHHNAVKHGYVEQWAEWPWSSALEFLRETGREDALKLWKDFPIGDYGVGWDD